MPSADRRPAAWLRCLRTCESCAGLVRADVLGEAAQQIQERADPGGDALVGGLRLELFHQLVEALRIANDLEQGWHRRIVELEGRPGERGGDDLSQRCRVPLLFPQDLRVVDFLDLEARAAGGSPEMGDAAVGADIFRGSAPAASARPPRGGVGAGIERHRAD